MKILSVAYFLAIACFIGNITPSFSQSPEQLFQKGLIKEEGEGNLTEAIDFYNKIVGNPDAGESLQAKALLHVGQCYEKLGRDEATKAYQGIVDNYPGQKNEVAIAQERLSLLMPIAKKAPLPHKAGEIVIRKFMDGTGSIFYGAPSPDGYYFAFIDYKTSPYDIVIREIRTGKETRLKNQIDLNIEGDEGTPYNPIWSPDSKQIAYVWENDQADLYEVRVIEVDNPRPKSLISLSYQKEWIKTEDWSPDGQHILVQLHQNDQDYLGLISTVDNALQLLKKLETVNPFSSKFSYNGKYIAYDNPSKQGSPDHDIYVLSRDGKQEIKLTSHPSHDYLLDWATGELKVLFASDRTGRNDMWSISMDEGNVSENPTLITENIGNIGPLGSTLDGSFYYSTPGSWWDISTINLDPETGKVTSPPTEIQLPNQGNNRHATWSPNGQYLAYVSVKRHLRQPNILCLYDRKTGSIKEYAFQKDVNPPVWFPDNQSILLFGSDALDITTGDMSTFVELNNKKETYSIKISSDNRYIYYATRNKDWDKHSIFKRNLKTGEEHDTYTTTDVNLTMSLSPDSKQLAVLVRHNEDTRILKLLSATDGSEKVIHTFKQDDFGYISTTWSPNGEYIYFSKIVNDSWELCRIPSVGGEAENLGVKKHLFTGISFHPDGNEITFTSFVGKEKPGGVWVMENYLSNERSLTENKGVEALPNSLTFRKVWAGPGADNSGTPSPDGQFLTYMDGETGNVAVRDLVTGKRTILTKEGTWDEPMQFTIGSVVSPDSKQVAYTWFNLNDNYEIRLTNFDKTEPKLLYGKNKEDVYPVVWSPNGKTLYARSYLNEIHQSRILAITVESGDMEVLKTFDFSYWMDLSVSPDNRFIVYDVPNDKDEGRFDIHLISANGQNEITLIEHPANDRVLGWFPDNNKLLFKSDRSGTWDAWIVSVVDGRIDGTPERIITDIGQARPMGFTNAGSFYYSKFSRKFSAFTARVDSVSATLKGESMKPLLGSIFYTEWSSDGKSLAYIKESVAPAGPGWYDRPLYVLDISSGEEKRLSETQNLVFPQWSPDNKMLLAPGYDEERKNDNNYEGGIYTIDVESGTMTELFSFKSCQECERGVPTFIRSVAVWSEDMMGIYYTQKDQLISRDLATGQEQILLDKIVFNKSLDLSPDGENLLFASENKLYALPAAGGGIINLYTVGEANEIRHAVWSPDGNFIFLTENMEKVNDGSVVWRISTDGTNPIEVWRSKSRASGLSIHPEGQEVVISTYNQEMEIWRLDNLTSDEIMANQ